MYTRWNFSWGSETYRIELATSLEERRQGLMYRETLGRREGMDAGIPASR